MSELKLSSGGERGEWKSEKSPMANDLMMHGCVYVWTARKHVLCPFSGFYVYSSFGKSIFALHSATVKSVSTLIAARIYLYSHNEQFFWTFLLAVWLTGASPNCLFWEEAITRYNRDANFKRVSSRKARVESSFGVLGRRRNEKLSSSKLLRSPPSLIISRWGKKDEKNCCGKQEKGRNLRNKEKIGGKNFILAVYEFLI